MQEQEGEFYCPYIICVTCPEPPTEPTESESERSNDCPSLLLTHRCRALLLCLPHHPALLSRPRLNNHNLRQQPRSLLPTHLPPANSPNSHLRRQVRTRAGPNPKPACPLRRHAKIGPWWTFSSCSTTMSHWCVSFEPSQGTRSR